MRYHCATPAQSRPIPPCQGRGPVGRRGSLREIIAHKSPACNLGAGRRRHRSKDQAKRLSCLALQEGHKLPCLGARSVLYFPMKADVSGLHALVPSRSRADMAEEEPYPSPPAMVRISGRSRVQENRNATIRFRRDGRGCIRSGADMNVSECDGAPNWRAGGWEPGQGVTSRSPGRRCQPGARRHGRQPLGWLLEEE